MKIVSNRVKTLLVSLLATLMTVFSFAPAFAVDTTSDTTTSVCTKIGTLSITSKTVVAGKITAMQTDFSNRLSTLSSNQTAIDAKIAADRSAASSKFDTTITSLKAESGLTATQSTAIDTFQAGVKAAELIRTTAVDNARSTYRTGLATQIATHQQNLSTAATAYQAAVTAAFTTATTNCTDANGAATLATLKASIKSARDALTTARSDAKVSAAIKALAATRDASIKSADDAFTKTLATLTATLKAALATTPSTNN